MRVPLSHIHDRRMYVPIAVYEIHRAVTHGNKASISQKVVAPGVIQHLRISLAKPGCLIKNVCVIHTHERKDGFLKDSAEPLVGCASDYLSQQYITGV